MTPGGAVGDVFGPALPILAAAHRVLSDVGAAAEPLRILVYELQIVAAALTDVDRGDGEFREGGAVYFAQAAADCRTMKERRIGATLQWQILKNVLPILGVSLDQELDEAGAGRLAPLLAMWEDGSALKAEQFICTIGEKKIPTKAQHAAVAALVSRGTGGAVVVPATAVAKNYADMVAMLTLLGATAGPGAPVATTTTVQQFVASITLHDETGHTGAMLAARRAHNAAAIAKVAAWNAATGHGLTTCGPAPSTVATRDPTILAARAAFAACQARAAAAFADYSRETGAVPTKSRGGAVKVGLGLIALYAVTR